LCSSNCNASAPSWRWRLLVSRVLMEGGGGIFSSTAATFDQDQLPTGQLPMIGYRRRWVSEPALHGCAQSHASADSLASPSAHPHVHASP
jgi:hypothetical protein